MFKTSIDCVIIADIQVEINGEKNTKNVLFYTLCKY
jgi:hypothetical protein